MKKIYILSLLVLSLFAELNLQAQQIATFDDLSLIPGTYWNGSDHSDGFTSGPAYFRNQYNALWATWSGFAYSNTTDDHTPGWINQYSAITGSGANQSANYGVAYAANSDTIDLSEPAIVLGMYVTNSTYAALSMRDGDSYSKKFGGTSGNDPDWFKLTINGWDADWQKTGTTQVYLADYRFENNGQDYILTNWQWTSLQQLGNVAHLTFSLSSSDNGNWGMNTPAYFCIDDLTTVPSVSTAGMENLSLDRESYWDGSDLTGGFSSGDLFFQNDYNPTYFSWTGWTYSNQTDVETAGWSNQYSSFAAKGAEGTSIFAVSYHYLPNTLELKAPTVVYGTYITNDTYAALSMRDGDAYSKKFGGATGNDADWFKLTITGVAAGGEETGTVEFYLADYRFDDNSKDYIVDSWQWVDLTSLGEVKKLTFSLSSTDNGDWGMNTPAYFCLDELKYKTLTSKTVTFTAMAENEPVEGLEVMLGPDKLKTDVNGQAIFSMVSPTAAIAYQIKGRGYETVRDTIDIYSDLNIPVTMNYAPVSVKFIVSYNNLPLQGATVTIANNTDVTDENGNVVFNAINPSTEIQFSVSKEGFEDYAGSLNTFTDSIVEISLDKSSVALNKGIEVNVYPNPVVNQLNIESNTEIHYAELYDISGKQVWVMNMNLTKQKSISVEQLPKGIYLLRITMNDEIRIMQIVKE